MATIIRCCRMLRSPFKRRLFHGGYVGDRRAARAGASGRGLGSGQIRSFHVASSTLSISAFMPESSSFPGVRSYTDLLDFSVRDPETFWGTVAKERLAWNRLFHTVRDYDFSSGRIAWFLGGQLNVSVNCLDRHANQSPNKVALIWERDEPGTEVRITYRELLETTCRLANTLKRYGVKKGDRVALYLPVSPLGIAAMLACARIGAVHMVVFAGFSSQALAGRICDAQCKVVITCNQGVRGGRIIELKRTVDEAVKTCPTVRHVFVGQRTDKKVPMGEIDIPLEEEMEKEQPVCDPESMESEDLLFLLYTSGSTGKPKGLVHTQAGYLLYASLTHKYVFDYQEGDIHGCVADIGWITGHSYVVYGPLSNGGTTVLFESTPIYPDPGRYWETVQRLKINQFYGAPTAIRLLLKHGDSWVSKYDRSSLKTLGTVGEPINHEAWQWYHNVVGEGRCTLVDTWWQTETGGICISPRPSEEGAKIVPTMAMRPFFGIELALMSEKDEHPQVPETAVIGFPHEIKGEASFAFIVLKDLENISESVIIKDLKSMVASRIAKYAVPDHIMIVKRLPKTRSGKIMRRVLKKIISDETTNLGDLSTLDDQSVIAEIIATYKKYKKDHESSQ
ncbi:acetyl-coenzyme A synthetase 2-like, mitochondrial isoform X2 [Mobula birostris]|uniref:acetyl-coenzyme A synthetase 2-like, mitochondrial isoform X2 n=1 Tax=Mobula birostris TaxID=1983395 RepID=UPI003B28DAD1